MVDPAIFGPIDAVLARQVVGPLLIEWAILALVLLNLLTRLLAHRQHVRQAAAESATITRHRGHESTNVLLVVASFYYMTLEPHAGIVLSVLVIGTVMADVFEFEARRVEIREDRPLDAPKGAIAGSLLVLGYAAFLSLFFLIADVWNAIV